MASQVANVALIEIAARQKYKTNHLLHLFLSLITGGFWVFIWVLVAISNSCRRSAYVKDMLTATGL